MTQSEYVGALLVPVVRPSAGWELPEETMPVTELHSHAVDVLRQLLRHWAAKSGARSIANDEAGNDFWLTEVEAARAEVAALKAELAKRGG